MYLNRPYCKPLFYEHTLDQAEATYLPSQGTGRSNFAIHIVRPILLVQLRIHCCINCGHCTIPRRSSKLYIVWKQFLLKPAVSSKLVDAVCVCVSSIRILLSTLISSFIILRSSELRVISVETTPGCKEDTVTPQPSSLRCRASAVITCQLKNQHSVSHMYIYTELLCEFLT